MPKINLAKIRPYAKAVVAVGGVVLAVANAIAAGGDVQSIVIAALTALGVYRVKNNG